MHLIPPPPHSYHWALFPGDPDPLDQLIEHRHKLKAGVRNHDLPMELGQLRERSPSPAIPWLWFPRVPPLLVATLTLSLLWPSVVGHICPLLMDSCFLISSVEICNDSDQQPVWSPYLSLVAVVPTH